MIPHDEIISHLEKELQNKGCITQSNEDYIINGQDGEVDLYGFDFKRKLLYVIEVKTHHSPKGYCKARHQLDKDEEYLRRLFYDFEPFRLIRIYCFNGEERIERIMI